MSRTQMIEVATRRPRGGALAGALAVAFAALLLAGGCGGKSDVVVRPAGTATPAATGASGAGAEATPSETPIPGNVVTTVKELVDRYGWPSGTDYARIRIPTIGVDAKVGARVVGRDAVMPMPQGPADIAWYDLAQWPGMGGSPGSGGNSIFSGHVDYAFNVPYAQVAYRGQGVFSQLHLLSQGDIIEVEYRGQTLRYKVVSRQQLGPATEWTGIWSAKVPKETITLYTCAGSFDAKTLEYSDRVVVRAERL